MILTNAEIEILKELTEIKNRQKALAKKMDELLDLCNSQQIEATTEET